MDIRFDFRRYIEVTPHVVSGHGGEAFGHRVQNPFGAAPPPPEGRLFAKAWVVHTRKTRKHMQARFGGGREQEAGAFSKEYRGNHATTTYARG